MKKKNIVNNNVLVWSCTHPIVEIFDVDYIPFD